MLVYTDKITPRLTYIFNLMLKDMLGLGLKLTDNMQEFQNSEGPRMVYGKQRIAGYLFIEADGLLFDSGVSRFPVEIFSYRGLPAFFQGEGHLPFDIFAASFYLVTRYEEYLPSKKDPFGRYKAKNSVAARHHFLDKPLVNYWIEELKTVFLSTYPELVFKTRHFNATMTFDIDVAYAYNGRSMLHKLMATAKDAVHLDFKSVTDRIRVATGKTRDPYDSYEYIFKSLEDVPTDHIFFFLLGARPTRYDRNLHPSSKALTCLIKRLDAITEVGIHPSYYSSENTALIKEEKQLLEELIDHPVTKSRQHYLRWQIPGTFLELAEAGIEEDYSMAYAETPGFRASICTPFPFYNLLQDKETSLIIHPVTYMEGSFIEDMAMQPEATLEQITELIKAVKEVNGHFICIWHNQTLSNYQQYEGWRKPYEATLRLLKGTE